MTLNQLRNRLLHRLRLKESWIVFFITGIVMMNFPFLSIFNKNEFLFGFPLLFLYFIIGWAFSIVIIYLFTLAAGNGDGDSDEQRRQ